MHAPLKIDQARMSFLSAVWQDFLLFKRHSRLFEEKPRMPLKRELLLLICCSWMLLATDGLSQPKFILNGDAFRLNDTCYRLTTDDFNKVGSIWNEQKINLNESFEVLVSVNLGCLNEGADGIFFGFQPLSTSIGGAGGGLGITGVKPSIGVEIDTWQNIPINDPAYDHIAIVRDGDLDHQSINNLAGPIQASATSNNIEDCDYHELRVAWDAAAQELEVAFDCVIRLTYTGDIVNEVFNGDPEVFWGFTSATGGAFNVQEVCFNYTTFLDELPDAVLCPGGQVQLFAKGGKTYEWFPKDGLNDPFVQNPIASPGETTTYLVEITDNCDFTFFNELTLFVTGDSVFFDLGPDTTICELRSLEFDVTTPTAEYLWSTGSTLPKLIVNQEGEYSVTVTRTDTFCIAEDWIKVEQIQIPTVDLGPDTVLCFGNQLLLDASHPFANGYEWTNGLQTPSREITQAGIYKVFTFNNCGTAQDEIEVQYEDCEGYFFPNAFSPNQDGLNDLFFPSHRRSIQQINFLRIFSRWGELLFEAKNFPPDDPTYGWDGTFKGKPLQPGTYFWLAEITLREGNKKLETGSINLIR